MNEKNSRRAPPMRHHDIKMAWRMLAIPMKCAICLLILLNESSHSSQYIYIYISKCYAPLHLHSFRDYLPSFKGRVGRSHDALRLLIAQLFVKYNL